MKDRTGEVCAELKCEGSAPVGRAQQPDVWDLAEARRYNQTIFIDQVFALQESDQFTRIVGKGIICCAALLRMISGGGDRHSVFCKAEVDPAGKKICKQF